MTNTEKDLSYPLGKNYRDLVNYYVGHPIALYTGAGVSWSKNKKFGVGSWDDFVRNILKEKNPGAHVLDLFDNIEWADKPWEMAEWVAILIGREEFRHHVMASIQKEDNFQIKYKLLSANFLRDATTLNSVAAFCAAFANGAITESKRGMAAVYERTTNRRVHAIVTTNYDPFLEAASSTMFRDPTLKPVAREGSSVGSLDEIPVFHIHGYVRFPSKFQKQAEESHTPFLDPVVTKSDYDSAWKAEDAYNPTMGPQIHVLRHYTVLFIGFSFRDQWVNNLLRRLNKERIVQDSEEKGVIPKRKRRARLYHYALMKKEDVQAKGEEFFDDLGVKPISLDSFDQIHHALGYLYGQALIHDYGNKKIELPVHQGKGKNKQNRPVYLTPDQYFEELCACRLSMVHKKKSWESEP